MNRIDATFQALRAAGRKGFVAYICAGDPNLKATAALARAFSGAGVDVLELGVPFSDPLADGVVNQLASERALRAGATLNGVLKMVAGLRRGGLRTPIVLYIYFNVVHRHGLKRFARDAAAAGVDGVLALDLPPEEAGAYEVLMKRAGVHPIYLIAPTTPGRRVGEIARHASGFLYYVSREGVTGMQKKLSGAIPGHVGLIRKHTRLPVALGFGISNPGQVRAAARMADAIVVGSAIVNQIGKHARDRDLVARVARFVKPMARAVHGKL